MPAQIKKISQLTWIAHHLGNEKKTGLISDIAKNFAISRPSASKLIKEFIQENWIEVSGSSSRPYYALGKNRIIWKTYKRENVDENLIWAKDFINFFELPNNIRNIAHHGFTEIANNAHDHSGGQNVSILMSLKDDILSILIADDGIGIFKKIQNALDLPDPRLSLLELSKGKLTTDSLNHSGEGIFFTSKMFDMFEIEANELHFTHDINLERDIFFEVSDFSFDPGTAVAMSISIHSSRTTQSIFEKFTTPGDFSFSKTIVPVKLASIGGENLISRSQAKRLVARFERFKTVILDFAQIEEIGQAFSDEVFRVFKNSHPDVELVSINTSDNVNKMINRIVSFSAK